MAEPNVAVNVVPEPVAPEPVAPEPVPPEAANGAPPATGNEDTRQLARNVVFGAFFAVLIGTYLALVPTILMGNSQFSGETMQAISAIYASVTKQWPQVWDYLPAVLVGFVVFATTLWRRSAQTLVLLGLSLLTLVAYLHLPSFLETYVETATGLDPGPARSVEANLVAFAGEVQRCMAVFLAALLGLKLSK